MKKRRLWIAYWRTQKKNLTILLFCIAVFEMIFFVYQFPMEGAVYGTSLCLGGVIVMEAYGFYRYAQHYRSVERIEKEILYGTQEFPMTTDEVERKYQDLIELLLTEKKDSDLEKERAYHEMEEYYTTWVHQIKTPIAAMRLLLKDDTEQTQEISMELFRIEQYVDMALQYVRLGGKSSDYQIRECDLDSIVRQAIRKYARLFIRKKIRLEYEGVDIKVITDEKWLLFVMEQILSNALKYTQKGKIRIYLLDQQRKELVIEDTGIGIAAQDVPRVFEQGFTGYNGRKQNSSTGIGLYLCRRIMERLSHKIWIESEIGKGTRVILGLETISLEYE